MEERSFNWSLHSHCSVLSHQTRNPVYFIQCFSLQYVESDGSLAIPSAELKHSGVYKAVAANQYGSKERQVILAVQKEGESCVPNELENTVFTRPIPILEFGKYVSELHADSNQPFIELYKVCRKNESIRAHTHTQST